MVEWNSAERENHRTQLDKRGNKPLKPSVEYTYPSPPMKRPRGQLYKAFNEKEYIKIFIIGIIIFIIGYLLGAITGYMEAPDPEDYEDQDNDEKYKEDLDWYNKIKRSLNTSGGIFRTVGVLIIIIALLVGAVIDDQLPPLARLGMLIALGLIAMGIM